MSTNITGFSYHKIGKRYVAEYTDGKWQKGCLTDNAQITLNECSCVLQYAQTCFEGLKAYRTKTGKIVCFRPELNEERLHDSCVRMMIPPLPEGMFKEAVLEVAEANREWIPDYESDGALYLRPFVFGKNAVMGVKPATEFEFRVFATPVGSYFDEGEKLLNLRISDYDRAAPHGTGNIKAGLNYAMSLFAITDAHEKGYDENVYLDSATRTYIEETGGANIIFITADNTLVTPKSDSILPSVTRRSLLYVAKNYLGLKTEERRVKKDELESFKECGLCGTAAVISPVGTIDDHGKIYRFDGVSEEESVIKKLYNTLIAIQHCNLPAPKGWITEIA